MKRIRKDGYIRLSALKSVFIQEGLSLDLYPAYGPKKWITDNFSEFAIAGNNGYECIRMPVDSSVVWCLSSQGINYKILGKGKRLTDWIQASFPDFRISEDNMWLFNDSGTVSANVPTSDTSVEHAEAELLEIQQMHALAYMKWWNVNIKKIHVFNDEITETQAKKTTARQMAKAMLGVSNILIDGMGED